MLYYIDFDSTLFHTRKFTKALLESLTNSCIMQNENLKFDEFFEEAKSLFNKENIYDIFKLGKYFADKYSLSAELIENSLHSTIKSDKQFVFDDVEKELTRLAKNNTLVLYTYSEKGSLSFQLEKIYNSGVANLFDDIIITSEPKGDFNLNYNSGIFVDDNVNVIEDISKNNPIKIYRIRREGTKYYDKLLPKNITATEIFGLSEIED